MRSLGPCGIKKAPHRGNAIGRNTYTLGVLMNAGFVGSQIDAIHFVSGDVAVEPLNLRPHSPQNAN